MLGDGKSYATCGKDKNIKIWDITMNKPSMIIETGELTEINYLSLSNGINYYSL